MGVPLTDEKAVFQVALSIESAEARQDYLNQVCGDNPALRARVATLLRWHEEQPEFLESPLAATAPTLDVAPIAERPGTHIGLYQLVRQLGEGGMGIVFLAVQQEPIQRQVALKIIRPGMDTREVIRRFEAERQALALMDHPHIAHVLDVGATESGRPYFVMELVPGVPITDYCEGHDLSLRQRLELFVTVCRAVQHAHNKGIIHRDLKPSNVLVAEDDDMPVAKVIDFGVAKATGAQLSAEATVTGWGQLVGTPLYMSPEQAGRGGQDVDTRSDIYSLGVLLYELLTGMPPFDRKRFREASYEEICAIIREQEPPKPSTRITTVAEAATTVSTPRRAGTAQLSRALRGELDWIVMKALEKDRTRRYATAHDFARDIERYLHDEKVEACPPSTTYRVQKFVRRHKTGVWAAAAIGLALLLGAGIATAQAIRATRAEQLADEQLRTAKEQERLAERQAQLAKQQQRLAEHQRELTADMLALAVVTFGPLSVQTGPDGTVFAFFDTGQLLRCDGHTGTLIDEFANFRSQGAVSRTQRVFFGRGMTDDPRPRLYLVSGNMTAVLDGVTGRPIREFTAVEPALPAWFGRDDIRLGPDGLIYELRRGGVYRCSSETWQLIDTFVTSTSPIHQADSNTDSGALAFGPDGDLYAAFWGLHNVQRYDGRTGALLNEFVASDARRLAYPREMAFGPDGNLYVATPKSVLTYSGSDGRLLGEIPGAPGEEFHSLFFQPGGRLCVSTRTQLLRLEKTSGRLEPFIRYSELTIAYLAQRVSQEPGLRVALTNCELQNLLAWSLVWRPGASSRDVEAAIELASAAVDASPNNGPIWHTLGAAYYRAGRWDESRRALIKADDLCGPTAFIDFFFSMVQSRLGNTREARVAYDRGHEFLRGLGSPMGSQLFFFQREAAELLGIAVSPETEQNSDAAQVP